MDLTETITALVDEGMRQSAQHAGEKKEKTMADTDTITRKVNQKEIKKIRVGKNIYPVESAVHSQDGVLITFTMKNGKTKEEFVDRGTFSARLITGYPTKKEQEQS